MKNTRQFIFIIFGFVSANLVVLYLNQYAIELGLYDLVNEINNLTLKIIILSLVNVIGLYIIGLISKRSLYIIILIISNLLLDQLSKIWIRANVTPYSDINIIADYFIITNVENSGAFLGLGSDFSPVIKSILLLALPVGVLVTVLVYVFKDTSIDKLSLIGYSSIIGGGIGNIYDRFLYGSVTDFLFIDLGGVFKTGIFNIADLSVTTGMILIVWASFKTKNE